MGAAWARHPMCESALRQSNQFIMGRFKIKQFGSIQFRDHWCFCEYDKQNQPLCLANQDSRFKIHNFRHRCSLLSRALRAEDNETKSVNSKVQIMDLASCLLYLLQYTRWMLVLCVCVASLFYHEHLLKSKQIFNICKIQRFVFYDPKLYEKQFYSCRTKALLNLC